jgi:glycerophosphoryl diester phosphodiesterase
MLTRTRFFRMRDLPLKSFLISTLVAIITISHGQQIVPPLRGHKPVIIAHRGNHEYFPENSLAAIRSAAEIGADYVEIDLRTTRDQQLVLMHDPSVNRTTNGQGLIRKLTLNQLQSLRLTDSSDTTAFSIPTFREVLSYCRGKIKIYLDFKEADVLQTIREIEEEDMTGNIVVYLNDPTEIKKWKSLAPTIPIMLSLPEKSNSLNALIDFRKEFPADILDGHWSNYNTDMIQYCKEQNIPIWVDVQSPRENKAYWQPILLLGFDGLQTDHPEQLIRLIKN